MLPLPVPALPTGALHRLLQLVGFERHCCVCRHVSVSLSRPLQRCASTQTEHEQLTTKLFTYIYSAFAGYHAPLDLYPEFHRIAKDPTLHSVPDGRPVSVCVGKEWYRFPSSFLLPHKSVPMSTTQVLMRL